MFLPERMPEVGPLAKLIRMVNQIRDYLDTLRPAPSHDTFTTHTAIGVFRQGNPAGEDTLPKHRGEWDASYNTSYKAQDQVKISNGQEAGNYVATRDIPAGDATFGPWTGKGWILIGRINDQSNWL